MKSRALVLYVLLTNTLLVATPVWSQASSEAAFQFASAKLLAGQGAYRAALDGFRRAEELVPDDPYLLLAHAELLFRLGDLRQAVSLAERSRELARENIDVLRVLGRLHLALAEQQPAARETAIEVFNAILVLRTDDLDALTTLGRLYQLGGQPERAAELFDRVVKLQPGSQRVVTMLARSLMEAGRLDEAQATLAGSRSSGGLSVESAFLLVDLQSERGDHVGAVSTLRELPAEILSAPRTQRRLAFELYQAERPEESLVVVDRLLEGADDSRLRLLRARLLEAAGRPEEAVAELEALSSQTPDDLEVAMQLAQLRADRGDGAAATGVLRELVGRLAAAGDRPDEVKARLQLAALLAGADDWEEVVAVLEPISAAELEGMGVGLRLDALLALGRFDEIAERVEGVELDELSGVQARVAEAFFQGGDEERAEELIRRMLSHRDLATLRNVALLYQRLERYEDVIPLVKELVELEPDSLQSRFWLGAAYERLGRLPEAAETFLGLLDEAPEFHPALNYLGYMWADKGIRLEDALRLTEKAVELAPGNGAYADSLGWVYFRLGETEAALRHLQRAAELSPREGTILEHLGEVYLALGDRDRAVELFRQALGLEVDDRATLEGKLNQLERSAGGAP